MADTTTTKVDKTRKTPRRLDFMALLNAPQAERDQVLEIVDLFKALPEPMKLLVASHIRKEMGQ